MSDSDIDAKLLNLLDRAAYMWEKQIGSGYFLKEMRDAVAAARAQAEDDARIVDDAWWEMAGFFYSDTIRGWIIDNGHINGDSVPRVEIFVRNKAIYINGRVVLNFIDSGITRGDVRRLLAALGVK